MGDDSKFLGNTFNLMKEKETKVFSLTKLYMPKDEDNVEVSMSSDRRCQMYSFQLVGAQGAKAKGISPSLTNSKSCKTSATAQNWVKHCLPCTIPDSFFLRARTLRRSIKCARMIFRMISFVIADLAHVVVQQFMLLVAKAFVIMYAINFTISTRLSESM